jgi:hypothetical protein
MFRVPGCPAGSYLDKILQIAARRAAAPISRLPYIYQDSCPPGSKTPRLGFIELIFNYINSKFTLTDSAPPLPRLSFLRQLRG